MRATEEWGVENEENILEKSNLVSGSEMKPKNLRQVKNPGSGAGCNPRLTDDYLARNQF